MKDYKSLIKDIYKRQSKDEQETLRAIMNDLHSLGFTDMFIYFAVDRINKKDGGFIQWRNLFFNKSFQEEIKELEQKELNKSKDNAELCARIKQQMEDLAQSETITIKRKPKEKKLKYTLDMVEKLDNETL